MLGTGRVNKVFSKDFRKCDDLLLQICLLEIIQLVLFKGG